MSDQSPLAPRRRGRPPKESSHAIESIRQAALQSFAEKGFQGASIIEIAQLAGVAKPLIHYHFPSKDELWQAAVSASFAQLTQELMQFQSDLDRRKDASLSELIKVTALKLVKVCSSHALIVRIVVDESGKRSERAAWLTREFLVPMYGLAESIHARFIARKTLKTDLPPASILIPALMGMLNFAFLDSQAIDAAFNVRVQDDSYQEGLAELVHLFLEKAFLREG